MSSFFRLAAWAVLLSILTYAALWTWGAGILEQSVRVERQLSAQATTDSGDANTRFAQSPRDEAALTAPLASVHPQSTAYAFSLLVLTGGILVAALAWLRYAAPAARPGKTAQGSEGDTARPSGTEQILEKLEAQAAQLDNLHRLLAIPPFRGGRPATIRRQARDDAPRRPDPSAVPIAEALHDRLRRLAGHLPDRQGRSADADAAHLALATLSSGIDDLLSVLADLEDLARLEYGAVQLQLQPHSLQQVVADAMQGVASLARESNLELRADTEPSGLPVVMTDADRLRRLLVRLMSSVIGAYDGPVPTRRQLVLTLRLEQGNLSVSMNGLDAAVQSGQTPEPPGTSRDDLPASHLDLAIGRRLLAQFQGELLHDISSGAFGARLPCHIVDVPTPGRLSPTTAAGSRGCRLMVVEPQGDTGRLCSALLASRDCTIEGETSLAGARTRLQSDSFDMVLIDIDPPGQAALDEASELKLVAAGAPKVVALCEPERAQAHAPMPDPGFDAVLAKPVDQTQLVATMQSLLNPQAGADRKTATEVPAAATWPQPLGRDTAARLHAALDLADIDALADLADELAGRSDVPRQETEALQRSVRLFDPDALRGLAERCARDGTEPPIEA